MKVNGRPRSGFLWQWHLKCQHVTKIFDLGGLRYIAQLKTDCLSQLIYYVFMIKALYCSLGEKKMYFYSATLLILTLRSIGVLLRQVTEYFRAPHCRRVVLFSDNNLVRLNSIIFTIARLCTLVQNGRNFSILLFTCKLPPVTSSRGKYSIEFRV